MNSRARSCLWMLRGVLFASRYHFQVGVKGNQKEPSIWECFGSWVQKQNQDSFLGGPKSDLAHIHESMRLLARPNTDRA